LSQIKPLNTLLSYFINIYFSILPFISRSSRWSLSFRFSHLKDMRRRLLWKLNFG
jgi:hypothetical protein